jgi:predicted dehydrogenase
VVGRDAHRTAALAAQERTVAFTDIDRMLDQIRPDLVTIALPNEHHFELTLKVIRAGTPVLVEKPLVFNLAEADLLLSEAEHRNLFFAINFNHRYAEPVRRAKAAIDAGRLGELVFSIWRFGGEMNLRGSHPHAQLIETQCHGFDMLEHLSGPIASVMAQMTNKTHGPYTSVAIALEFADGAVGSLVGSYDSSYAYPLAQFVEVNGAAGRLLIEDTVKRLTISRSGDESREVWEAGYFNDLAREFHRTFDRHVDDLVPALLSGAEPPIHASAGRRALALAQACIESFETGRRVITAPVEH